MSNEKDVGFYAIPLTVDIEEVRKGLSDDVLLNKAIKYYTGQLAADGVEVWSIEKNMAVTERGYFVALYEKEEKENEVSEEKSLTEKYIDLCERTVAHLISLIYDNKLGTYFDKQVLEDAKKIRLIHSKRKNGDK